MAEEQAEPEAAQEAGYPTEDDVQEMVDARVKEQEQDKTGGLLTGQQIIHEMAIKARDYYGLNREEVVQRQDYDSKESYEAAAEGYVNLVDAWLMLPAAMEEDYDETFLRQSTVIGWERRFNRHLIPNKYVLAMKGIDMAIYETTTLQPRELDRRKFDLVVKFPPVGPPLAWYGIGAPSRRLAETWAERYTRGGMTEADVYQRIEQKQAQQLVAKFRTLSKNYRETAEKLSEAVEEGKSKQRIDWLRNQAWNYRQRIDDLQDQVQELQQLQEKSKN